MRKMLAVGLIIVASLFLLSEPHVLAQDFCRGDLNYDGNVDGGDVGIFLADFGRSQYNNPCPSDGPTPVPKTGQKTSFVPGDDGDLERGVGWVTPRFTDNLDGTVTDNQTGLIWLKDANCIATNYPEFDGDFTVGDGMVFWQHALDFVAGINYGTYPDCGADNTDWRLPNYKEVFSLVDAENYGPALPTGHPFINGPIDFYWASTTDVTNTTYAWGIRMGGGYVSYYHKGTDGYVWPVRGGQ